MTFKNSMSLNRGILQNSKSNNIFVLIPKLDIKNSHLLTKGKKKKNLNIQELRILAQG